MLSTVVLSNENQTCRGWEAPTSTGGGGCHDLLLYNIFETFYNLSGEIHHPELDRHFHLLILLHPLDVSLILLISRKHRIEKIKR